MKKYRGARIEAENLHDAFVRVGNVVDNWLTSSDREDREKYFEIKHRYELILFDLGLLDRFNKWYYD